MRRREGGLPGGGVDYVCLHNLLAVCQRDDTCVFKMFSRGGEPQSSVFVCCVGRDEMTMAASIGAHGRYLVGMCGGPVLATSLGDAPNGRLTLHEVSKLRDVVARVGLNKDAENVCMSRADSPPRGGVADVFTVVQTEFSGKAANRVEFDAAIATTLQGTGLCQASIQFARAAVQLAYGKGGSCGRTVEELLDITVGGTRPVRESAVPGDMRAEAEKMLDSLQPPHAAAILENKVAILDRVLQLASLNPTQRAALPPQDNDGAVQVGLLALVRVAEGPNLHGAKRAKPQKVHTTYLVWEKLVVSTVDERVHVRRTLEWRAALRPRARSFLDERELMTADCVSGLCEGTTVCERCVAAGHTAVDPLLRACARCQRDNVHCVRAAVVAVAHDSVGCQLASARHANCAGSVVRPVQLTDAGHNAVKVETHATHPREQSRTHVLADPRARWQVAAAGHNYWVWCAEDRVVVGWFV